MLTKCKTHAYIVSMTSSRRRSPDRTDAARPTPRLSQKEHRILDLLASGGELYGLALVERSEGELKRGTVYVTLQRMEAKQLVESRPEQLDAPRPGLPRRLYRPTRRGLALLRALDRASAELAALEGLA